MTASPRADGRAAAELRPLSILTGELARADGSGRFGFGSTAALASFSGPIEVRLREELPDRATVEVIHRPLEGVGGTPSRALESALSSLLTPLLNLSQHPRSLIQLVVQSLSAPIPVYTESGPFEGTLQNSWPAEPVARGSKSPLSGLCFSSRAAAINAMSLAALDAGSVAMRGVAVGVSLAYLPRGEESELVLDPTSEEEARATSRHGFAWAFGVDLSAAETEDSESEAELVWIESEGRFTRLEYDEALSLSRTAAKQILGFIRKQMEARFAQR